MKKFILLAAAAICIFCLAAPSSAEPAGSDAEVNPVYCDIRDYEDFYYFPVKACDGITYNFYVFNFGDGCGFNIEQTDMENPMAYFQYVSDFGVNKPAERHRDISLKEMNAYLEKYDFRKMGQCQWLKETDDNTFNKDIAVMRELTLTKKFDGDIKRLSPASYNENWMGFSDSVIPYKCYNNILAEFYDYGGKTVVKLSGEDFFSLSELIKKNEKTLPEPEETSKAYYATSDFEGYFYCDPRPLEEYLGRTGEKPSKTAKAYYTNPRNIKKSFPEEDLTGKTLSDFLDAGDFSPDDSRYFLYGNAAVCPPEKISECDSGISSIYFRTSGEYEFRLWEIEKDDMTFPPDTSFNVKKSGKLFGKPCKYYEYIRYEYDISYAAELLFEIDEKYYMARAAVYSGAWETDFRRYFGQFFGSIRRASDIEKTKFGKAPAEYFKSLAIKEKEYTSACEGLKLYVPESIKDIYSDEKIFYAKNKNNIKSMSIEAHTYKSSDGEPLDTYYQNFHKAILHKYWCSYDDIKPKLLNVFNFRRNGADCTLVIRKKVDFLYGWQTDYTYYIDCGDKFYMVYVNLPEKSENTEEEAIKVLSSIKVY